MLPHVLRFNGSVAVAEGSYGEILCDAFPEMALEANSSRHRLGSSELLANCFERLALDLGIETRLTQVGISSGDIQLIARQAMQQTRLLPNNPREVRLEDAERLYAMAL